MMMHYGKGHEFKIMNTALNRSMLLVRARRLYLPQWLKRGANILFALLHGVVYMQHGGGRWPRMIIKVMSKLGRHTLGRGQTKAEKPEPRPRAS